MTGYIRPSDIENESMNIITNELAARGIALPEENVNVVKRVIHTTADFDFAKNLIFSKDAVSRAKEILRSGCVIVTDTNMALAGINSAGLKKLGCTKACFMADPLVRDEAKKEDITRAAVSVRHAVREFDNIIFASGNAPTFLLELEAQIHNGLRPEFVIGVPVGFVNVTEAKERIMSICGEYNIPYIVSAGRKGGSTVAAAICNALIIDTLGKEKKE